MKFKAMIQSMLAMALDACSGGSATPAPGKVSPTAAQLGRKIFEDITLSESGQQSCATCHVPAYAFAADPTSAGPDHGSPVPLSGPDMAQPGFRNTPALMDASFPPAFFFDGDGNPNGGFFRDGRATTLAEQAIVPFTTPFEMSNTGAAAVIAKLKTRPDLSDLTALYGSEALNDPQAALQRMGQAIAAYETEGFSVHSHGRLRPLPPRIALPAQCQAAANSIQDLTT